MARSRDATVLGLRRWLRGPAWIVAALAVWFVGCSGDKIVAGPDEQEPEAPAFLAIVSNAVGVAAAAGPGRAAAAEAEVAYISLPPGSIPGGEVATIRNRRTGATVTTPVIEGGFDPVSVVAQTGDTLQMEVRVAGTTSLVRAVFGVPPRRRPIVVRTDPPPKKRDVPLNASMLIVFSEPVDPATLGPTSVRLSSGGGFVAGTVVRVPGSPWIAAFTPNAPLAPETDYELAVTQEVRDFDGESLEAPVNATFTTGATFEGRIAFVSTRDNAGGDPWGSGYIYVASADGSAVRRLTRGDKPSWSWDGERIAFHRWSGGSYGSGVSEVWVINASGTDERKLGPGHNPVWSPDGTKIVFTAVCGSPGGGIFVMNADGSNVSRLLSQDFASPGESAACASWPSWSPDGRSITFVRTVGWEESWRIYIMNADGSQARPLDLTTSIGDSRPVWSPDGSRLLLQIPSWTIASVFLDGSDFRIYTGASYVGDPDWSPDGTSIAFSRFSAPGDASAPPGTRMRIFVVATAGGSTRQLIPEAVAPTLPNYWDHEVAWSRVRP